ncbi:MAG: pilus assembly protein TadG-related protein [Roseiarcus sp.]
MTSAAFVGALERFGRDRRANVALMFSLLAVPLMLAVGVGVDYGMAAKTRVQMQAALDAAVLAGAAASSTQSQIAALAVARRVFAADTQSLASGATTSFAFNSKGNLTGAATYEATTLFGTFTGSSSVKIAVASEASAAGSTVCILLLAPSTVQSLLVNSGANVTATNCELDSKSLAAPAAVFNAGSNFTFTKLCLQGADIIENGGSHPNLDTGCSAAGNPFVGKLPAPPSTACTNTGTVYGSVGTVNFSPGVYCGPMNFNFPTTVNFAPGLYVIKGGDWTVTGGTWNGAGVAFYFPDASSIQFNSGMSMNLTAPTAGRYAGILFYEVDGLSSSNWVWDASVSETLSGLIYLPSRNLTWNSPSSVVSHQLTMIANTAIFDNMNWRLTGGGTWSVANGGGGSLALMQ